MARGRDERRRHSGSDIVATPDSAPLPPDIADVVVDALASSLVADFRGDSDTLVRPGTGIAQGSMEAEDTVATVGTSDTEMKLFVADSKEVR